jgi:hypothetical protein
MGKLPDSMARKLNLQRMLPHLALALIVTAGLLPAHSIEAADKRTPAPELGQMTGPEASAFYLGANAIIWGYPSILFEDLMRQRTSPDIIKLGNPQSAVNQFGLMRQLRGPEYKQIATPNNDTLFAQAFCDVSREPLVLSVPAVAANRYYTFQLWDPNGDTFAYVGSRTTGRAAGHYALVAPGWQGELPANVKRIDSPSDSLVVWGRIGVDGPKDLKNALEIEDQLRLTPLSQFGQSEQQVAPDLDFSRQRVAFELPKDLPEGLELYAKLAHALQFTPPKPGQDAVVAASLEQIGFKNGNRVFDYHSLTPSQRTGLIKGAQFALHLMDVSAQSGGADVKKINGWRWSAKSGVMGNDYLFRAAFAKWYTGGNAPEEAVYMDARQDEQGQAFNGKGNYVLHFDKGQLPPAKAFWSVSMYNLADGSFVENPINRYSFGNRTEAIVTNDDGSLDIYLQHQVPSDPKQRANWLPAPAEGFYLIMRIYNPDERLQSGRWAPPPVKQLSQ